MPAPSDPGAAAGSELVDVLDDEGRVTGTATRRQVRDGNLLHRSVFVAVVDGADRVVVHQRAAWKDVWPSRWDLAFGGVVDAGESWVDAALRELREEAGIDGELQHLGPGRYEDESVREVAEVFLVRADGPFTFADGEVVASDRVPVAGLDEWLATTEVVPDSSSIVVPLLREALGMEERR